MLYVLNASDNPNDLNAPNDLNVPNGLDVHNVPHAHHSTGHSGLRRRKKSLSRRIRHKLKDVSKSYWSLVIAILLAIITAFYFMPALIRFLTEPD